MDDKIILREMNIDDAKEAAILCRKIFGKHGAPRRKHLEDAACSWRHEYYVAELDGKIIACMGARTAEWFEDYYEAEKKSAYIEVVAVDPDYQGRGIGTKLFAKLIDRLDNIGVKSNCLHVHPSNTPAIEFYKHFGFRGFEARKNSPYFDPNSLIMMRINSTATTEQS